MTEFNIGAPSPEEVPEENLEEKLKEDPIAKPEPEPEPEPVEVVAEAPKGRFYCVYCLDSKGCGWKVNKYVINAGEEKCPECKGEIGCTVPNPKLMK